ncbi:hypothetical protein T484DRAFT_3395337 [Baffinella frigidus]|nr:hypothetical protein T484DRAFT_3395337 [Cryptophyta sp. CCMP2293]
MGLPAFKIQKHMPEKHGSLRKQGRLMGAWVTRHYKIDWQSSHAVLLAYKSASMTGQPKAISLEHCFVRSNKDCDQPNASGSAAFCIELDGRHGALQRQYHLYASSEMEREEWVQILRKHAVNSSIDNGYEIRRDDNDTKLGSGSYSTVWKGKDRDNNKVWALKEMQKANVKRDEEENLREEVRISQMVGSHGNIVYMKEFVENKVRTLNHKS